MGAADWTVQHRSPIVWIAIAAAVILAIVAGSWYYIGLQDEKASLALSQALRTAETPIRPANMPPQPGFPSFASSNERDTAARKQYQDIVDKYSHTRSADVARYLLRWQRISRLCRRQRKEMSCIGLQQRSFVVG
jgi:hypothetical protein